MAATVEGAQLSKKSITFRHPDYSNEGFQNILIQLPGFDDVTGGVHHQTALIVCGIVACNRYSTGFFSVDPYGQKIDIANEQILKQDDYYYHISDRKGNEPYPVCPTFADWEFPHGNLPPAFESINDDEQPAFAPGADSGFGDSVRLRDRICRVSGYGDALEAAHLCPQQESAWFAMNSMGTYCVKKTLTGNYITWDIANAILLRADIHKRLDARDFAFVPRDGEWKLHFFQNTVTLGKVFHNKPTHPFYGHPAFLLTRLAWTIFPRLTQFLASAPQRRVKIKAADAGGWIYKEESLTRLNLTQRLEQPKPRASRSASANRPNPSPSSSNRIAEWDWDTASDGEGLIEAAFGPDQDSWVDPLPRGRRLGSGNLSLGRGQPHHCDEDHPMTLVKEIADMKRGALENQAILQGGPLELKAIDTSTRKRGWSQAS